MRAIKKLGTHDAISPVEAFPGKRPEVAKRRSVRLKFRTGRVVRTWLMLRLGWEVSRLFNVNTMRHTHDTGSVNGDGSPEIRGMFLNVRPDVFAAVLSLRIREVFQLPDATRALALGARGPGGLRPHGASLVIFGRVSVHPIEIEKNWPGMRSSSGTTRFGTGIIPFSLDAARCVRG